VESERSDLTSTQGTPGRPESVLLMDLASLLLAGTGVYLYLLDQEGDRGGDQKVVSVVDAG